MCVRVFRFSANQLTERKLNRYTHTHTHACRWRTRRTVSPHFIHRWNPVHSVCIASMTNQTQGIQQLLAAEKKAADKVGEARKRE